MKPVPINAAEAVFEPFWDPQLSGLARWRIADGASHGLRVSQFWCYVRLEWARKPESGPVLCMTRPFEVDCAGYDRLLVSLVAPKGARLTVTVETDRGPRECVAPLTTGKLREVALDLDGALVLRNVTLALQAGGAGGGWLNWIGLQKSGVLPHHLQRWEGFDDRWETHLKSPDIAPRFQPALGLVVDAAELARLQERHAEFLARNGSTPFTRAAEEARKRSPETMIREYVNCFGDHIFSRERDAGIRLNQYSLDALWAGVLTKDRDLLRLGARYAMALALCRRWETTMECAYPGGVWEQRCFSQSVIAHELALVLDLAGDLFTEVGRDLLMRRLAEEALGSINFNTWKHDYIFDCNQLAWFSTGRMAAYALLEKSWPRVKPYTEIAYRELLQNLDRTILPDGGYVEGPTYFRCVGRDAGLSLYYYARARGLPFQAVIPESMKRTAAFGAALASTVEESAIEERPDVIPICDAHAGLEHDVMAVMAAALPDSAWVTMFRKAIARTGGIPGSILAFHLEPQIPARGPDLPAFVSLPEMGLMASVRKVGGDRVKLLLLGNKAGAGHTHEDKGSFVLEFAGDAFAMDPGICNYGNSLVHALKSCERHNMLVPSGLPEQARPANPLPHDVKPAGQGDGHSFHARMDLAAGWEPYYKTWVRSWESPAPDRLTIRDEYELLRGSAVEFYWQTQQTVAVQGCTVILTGRRGLAEIEFPADGTIRVEELPMEGDHPQRRIAFRREGTRGAIVVQVRLRLA